MGCVAWLSNVSARVLGRRLLSLSSASALGAWPSPIKIVGFGDSLMAGYGLDAGESFPEKLEAALRDKGHDVVIANAGVSGDTTSGGLSRLDWSVPDGTQLVILELGANDMLRGIAPDITEKNLDAHDRAAEGSAASPCCSPACAPRPISGPTIQAAFDAIYPRLAEKYGVALYPFFLDGVAADRELSARGRHASERRGHRPHGRADAAGRREAALPQTPDKS